MTESFHDALMLAIGTFFGFIIALITFQKEISRGKNEK
jgi:hypothetical protein